MTKINSLIRVNFVFLVSIFFLCPNMAEASQEILSVNEIRELIPKIEAAERNLLNVKIESEVWMEESKSLSGPWNRTPVYISATSWFLGHPIEKARVDIHTEVSKGYWVDKDQFIYSEKSYKTSYDGQFGRMLFQHYKENGKKININSGEIFKQLPDIIKGKRSGVVTGLRLTTNYFFIDNEEIDSFSQYFKAAISPEALNRNAFEFAREEYKTVNCIKFSLKSGESFRANWWFDPSRGFALLGHEKIRRNKEGVEFIEERIQINKLEKVAEDIWWPVDGTIESERRKQGEPYTRTVYRAFNVIANDPNIDSGIFSIVFPVGCTVDDKINNRKYIVTEDPNSH